MANRGGRGGSRGRGRGQSHGRRGNVGSGRINVNRLDGDEYNPPPQRTRGRSEPTPRRLGDWVDNDPPPPLQFAIPGGRAPGSASDWARDQGYGGARPRTTTPVRQSSRGGRLMGRSYADPSELAPGTAPYWSGNQGYGGARPRTTSPVRQPSRGGRLMGRSYADPSELAPGTAPYWSGNMGSTTPRSTSPVRQPFRSAENPRDVMEDLRSVSVRECLAHDDPAARFYERRFERVPLHHRASWHLDRLQINAPSPQDPRQLPQMTTCYAGETRPCELHSPDDTDSACHIKVYPEAYKNDLEGFYERKFYFFLNRIKRHGKRKEDRYDKWDKDTGARLPRSRLNLDLTPPRESDEDEEDEC